MSKWFHGSPVKGIKTFVVDKPRYDSLEGAGVYLTKSYSIAREYAGREGSVYEVEISGSLLDLTTFDTLKIMTEMASKIVEFDVLNLEYLSETLDGVLNGRFQIGPHKGMGVGWQIKNLLLNHEPFITQLGADDKALQVEIQINDHLLSHDAWMYEDSKLGIVVVVKNPDKVSVFKEILVGSEEDSSLYD